MLAYDSTICQGKLKRTSAELIASHAPHSLAPRPFLMALAGVGGSVLGLGRCVVWCGDMNSRT
ncbi:hypothetical protein ACFVT2_25300, partial [Streptomyces sp. NPDC058000]|uniref:hypothetical protein n=1 Tax=Streptomyces sp. NPDC058000 TaxID=3346299 RepID=UPI0036EB25EC